MKIVPFPRPDDAHDETTLGGQIEAALHGESGGAAADSWRELRADVRSLAPPMSPEFERELRERLDERAARPRAPLEDARRGSASLARSAGWAPACARACSRLAGSASRPRSSRWRSSFRRSRQSDDRRAGEPRSRSEGGRARSLGGGPRSSGPASQAPPRDPRRAVLPGRAPSAAKKPIGTAGWWCNRRPGKHVVDRRESAPARVQQRAASITLAPKPEGVQSVADQVAQLAARDGGFVQSSQVHLQQGAAGEANLQLSLPSARLSAALAELARLAPYARAEPVAAGHNRRIQRRAHKARRCRRRATGPLARALQSEHAGRDRKPARATVARRRRDHASAQRAAVGVQARQHVRRGSDRARRRARERRRLDVEQGAARRRRRAEGCARRADRRARRARAAGDPAGVLLSGWRASRRRLRERALS